MNEESRAYTPYASLVARLEQVHLDAGGAVRVDELGVLGERGAAIEDAAEAERLAHERGVLRVLLAEPTEALGGAEQHVAEDAELGVDAPALEARRASALDARAERGGLGRGHLHASFVGARAAYSAGYDRRHALEGRPALLVPALLLVHVATAGAATARGRVVVRVMGPVAAVPTEGGLRLFGQPGRVGFAGPPAALLDRATGTRVLAPLRVPRRSTRRCLTVAAAPGCSAVGMAARSSTAWDRAVAASCAGCSARARSARS